MVRKRILAFTTKKTTFRINTNSSRKAVIAITGSVTVRSKMMMKKKTRMMKMKMRMRKVASECNRCRSRLI